jgi:hypothetical protein
MQPSGRRSQRPKYPTEVSGKRTLTSVQLLRFWFNFIGFSDRFIHGFLYNLFLFHPQIFMKLPIWHSRRALPCVNSNLSNLFEDISTLWGGHFCPSTREKRLQMHAAQIHKTHITWPIQYLHKNY